MKTTFIFLKPFGREFDDQIATIKAAGGLYLPGLKLWALNCDGDDPSVFDDASYGHNVGQADVDIDLADDRVHLTSVAGKCV